MKHTHDHNIFVSVVYAGTAIRNAIQQLLTTLEGEDGQLINWHC